jgi:acyl-CoA synthetase (AMP-forming)/AMP-acid ligase II
MSRQLPIGHWPGEDERNNLLAYLERHVARHPDRIALRWADPSGTGGNDDGSEPPLAHEEITYAELEQRIRVTAAGLAELGVRAGDRVMLFLPMSPEMYVSMFAVQGLGAIAVFLDSWARRDQLASVLARVEPRAMISHRAAFERLSAGDRPVPIPIRVLAGPGESVPGTTRLEDLMRGRERAPLRAVAGSHSALVTFTTGSSGRPKGADRTHRFLSAQHLALSRILPYRSGDRDLPAFPIFSLNNLASGVTTVLPAIDLARPTARDASVLVRQIRHEQVTCATLSPSNLRDVARYCRERAVELPGLRRVVTGGAPIGRDDVRAFAAIAPSAEILVLYGSTEVEPIAHITGAEMLRRPEPADREVVPEGVDVGRLADGLDARLLRIVRGPVGPVDGWADLEVPAGEVGELVVAGEHVCERYFRDEEAERRTKIRDADGRTWHRTGDLARVDGAGHLWIVGRMHNVVERSGRPLFPVRAEMVLGRVPHVRRAAFVGIPDSGLGQRAVAVAELVPGADPREARSEIRRLLAKNGIPCDAVRIVDELPLDPRHHSKPEYELIRRLLRQSPVRKAGVS